MVEFSMNSITKTIKTPHELYHCYFNIVILAVILDYDVEQIKDEREYVMTVSYGERWGV